MDRVRDILYDAVSGYAGEALNGYSYLTTNTTHDIFTIVSVGEVRGKHIVDTGLIVRLVGDTIIIEHDVNDKPLVDALMQKGIPRQQIVLAYAGEKRPAL